MDTKKIRALLLAVELGSLTAAANQLGYTQSGLTHMMNSLEDELGLNLLVRSKNGVHLSPSGQELLMGMRAVDQTVAALEKHAEQLRQKGSSTLRLGAYSSVSRQWLPSILAEFRRVCPDTEVSINVGGIHGIYDGVRKDKLDCAIVSYEEELCHGFGWVPLRDDALVAILPRDTCLEGSSFPVSGFSGKEFLMPADGFQLDIDPVFNASREKITPKVLYTNLDDASIVSMVAHSLGMSILSELVMQSINDDVLVTPLLPPAWRRLGIITSERGQNDRNIRRFVRCAQSVIGRMYREQ